MGAEMVHDAERMELREPLGECSEQLRGLRLRQPRPRQLPFLERIAAHIFLHDDRLIRVLRAKNDFRPERRRVRF